jgi:hypothetical protein
MVYDNQINYIRVYRISNLKNLFKVKLNFDLLKLLFNIILPQSPINSL